jgi:hypothetical protein
MTGRSLVTRETHIFRALRGGRNEHSCARTDFGVWQIKRPWAPGFRDVAEMLTYRPTGGLVARGNARNFVSASVDFGGLVAGSPDWY